MKLFTTPHCTQCIEAKVALKNQRIEYTEYPMHDDLAELTEACIKIGVDATMIKSAPVLIVKDQIWSGADCAIAILDQEWM